MGLFCDAGCTVVFSSTDVKVFDKHNNLILQGFRELEGPRMWRFNLLPYQQTLTTSKQLACNVTTSTHEPSTSMVPTTKPFKNSTEYHRRAYDLPSTKNLMNTSIARLALRSKDLSSTRLKQATTVHSLALLSPTLSGIVLSMQRPQCLVTLHKFHKAYAARDGPLQRVLC